MSSLNKVTLIGNLGRDPEVRRTQANDPVVSLSIATSETWRDKVSGEKRERTEWHRVVIFNENLAKVAEQYLKKGSKVYLEGQLQTRKYEQNGVEKYTTEVVLQRFRGEIVLLGDGGSGRPPPASGPEDYGTARARGENPGGAAAGGSKYGEAFDDDIPF